MANLFLANISPEPEFTGITVHETTDEIDAGAIIHQEVVKLNKEDGIHENACRKQEIFQNFSKLFSKKVNELNKIKFPQKISGRNFTESCGNRVC